jgi:CheY-like chemotaxis protein
MPSGGIIKIAATAETVARANDLGLAPGSYILISTRDEGVGMDAETRQRAIEPFFSTKGLGKGTGLGLSMVHGLAAQSGGALRLKSAPGQGTEVQLWLPATEERSATMRSRTGEVLQAAAFTRVLLVDDEELVRQATADMLADLGYDVVQASSGSQAISAIQLEPNLDLIVSDYLMPGMSGADLVRELRASGVLVPILLITGYARCADDVPADVLMLSKPFRQADLAERVQDLLKRKHARFSARSLRIVE